ncbi:type IV secretion system protein [Phenylobacterium sp.]|uniref:type IV secretion system protein n=1 Tax=Phenylobacterium sp. TaxID=1871053 RepID=UPI002734A796|nr:type IV secretion system protein [Phenylobacterium sp.]MDP3635133.1 type IV secretion system protein [Phenylobacterium sp.]
MRPLLLTAILIGLAPAAQAQTIVHDPTSYAKLLEQARTSLEQLQRLQTQVEQGQTLLKSLNEASNLGSLAAALESPILQNALPDAAAFVGATPSDVAALGGLGQRAQALRDAARIYAPANPNPVDRDLEASGLRSARDLALGEAVSQAGVQRQLGLQALRDAIDAAPTARAVLDLQARLAAEQAIVANDQMRLQGLAITQAAQAQQQAQRQREQAAAARAARMDFYRRGFE